MAVKPWRLQLKTGWRAEWEETVTDFVRERVKEARLKKGYSQRELSEIITRSNSYISQIESGRLDVSIVDLIALSTALDQPVRYFVPVYEMLEGELNPQEAELLREFRGIKNPELKDAAVRQVAELAKLEKKPKGNK